MEECLGRRSKYKPDTPQLVMGVAILIAIMASLAAKSLTGKVFAFAAGALLAAAIIGGAFRLLRTRPPKNAIRASDATEEPWRDVPPEADARWQEIWQRISKTPAKPSVDTSRWSMELLRALEWHRLELLCAAYFEALGFKAELTSFGADGGIDIKVYPEGSTQCAILVQCKAWNARDVGVERVRELAGVMSVQKITEGVFVTTGGFTPDAKAFGQQANLHLIDGLDLLTKLTDLPVDRSKAVLKAATEGDFTTPTCPSCGIKMKSRSKKDGGGFWGCPNYPRCRSVLNG
jgi:restriction system protein